MISKKIINRYRLKLGTDYIRICGQNMKSGDSFKFKGKIITITDIVDELSFFDSDYEFWHVSMFDNNDVICNCQMGVVSEYRKYTDDFKE